MLTEKNISDKYKYCEFCGRTLPKHYEGTLCPTCQEAQLFRNVRDYIRANTVNEYEVAETFPYSSPADQRVDSGRPDRIS